MKLNRTDFYLYLSLLLAIFILYLSVIPQTEIGPIKNAGFFEHIFAYFILALFLSLYFLGRNVKKALIKAILIAGTYGLLIEFIQFFIPYRHFQVFDIIVNFLGAFFVFFLPLKKWLKY